MEPIRDEHGDQRQGIIPCGRCAFFVPDPPPTCVPMGVQEKRAGGTCRIRHPIFDGRREAYAWPLVDADPKRRHGCGEGLLREHAAPLPPETKGGA